MGESLTTYSLSAASMALAQSDIGETYYYHSPMKQISAHKFELFGASNLTSVPQCGTSLDVLTLPLSILQQYQGVFDCVAMSSTTSLLQPQSNLTAPHIENSSVFSASIFRNGGAETLSSHTSINLDVSTTQCAPYSITFAANLSSLLLDPSQLMMGVPSDFVSCDLWDSETSSWDTDSCFLANFDSTGIVTCGCTRLGTLRLSEGFLVLGLGLSFSATLTSDNLIRVEVGRLYFSSNRYYDGRPAE